MTEKSLDEIVKYVLDSEETDEFNDDFDNLDEQKEEDEEKGDTKEEQENNTAYITLQTDYSTTSFTSSTCYNLSLDFRDYNEVPKDITHIAPFLNVNKVSQGVIGQGVYGCVYIGPNTIFIREDLYDSREVDEHEHIHVNAPHLSEYEVRLTVRYRNPDKTLYH